MSRQSDERLQRPIVRLAVRILASLSTLLWVGCLAAPAGPTGDGPHGSLSRTPAPLKIWPKAGGVSVRDFDLGHLRLAGKANFVTPLRGVLVLPRQKNAPLVIIGHLRSPSCADNEYRYPCAAGVAERRLDRGMTYLGEALGRAGYAVLIPDLGPLYVGSNIAGDYDQIGEGVRLLTLMQDQLARAVAGQSAGQSGQKNAFGPNMRGAIDMQQADFISHSRSGYLGTPLAQAWAKGPTRLTSLLALEPAYDINEVADDGKGSVWTGPHADLPYLSVISESDADVALQSNELLSYHIAAPRRQPALVGTVSGFGHMFFNRAMSAAGQDDRTDCQEQGASVFCPNAATHEQFLTKVALSWLQQRHTFPLKASDALPTTLGGRPVRWLAATNANSRLTLLPNQDGGQGKGTSICRFFEAGDPKASGPQCPETELGVVDAPATWLRRVSLGQPSAVTLPLTPKAAPKAKALSQVVLHLMPADSLPNGRAHSGLQVVLHDSKGGKITLSIAASSAALRNRWTPQSNGVYLPTTVRLSLEKATGADLSDIRSLTLGGNGTGAVYARAVDVVYRP